MNTQKQIVYVLVSYKSGKVVHCNICANEKQMQGNIQANENKKFAKLISDCGGVISKVLHSDLNIEDAKTLRKYYRQYYKIK